MKNRVLKSLVASLSLLICGTVCRADIITAYTDPSAFAVAVAPGSLTDNYTGFGAGTLLASYSDSNSTFGYSASAVDPTGAGMGLYGISTITPTLFGADYNQQSVTLTIILGKVTAVGGYFYNTDVNNNFLPDPVSLTLNYGNGLSTTVTFTPTSIGTSFFGFTDTQITSGGSITSLVENTPGAADYASMSTFTVGAAVIPTPEPSTLVLSAITSLCLLGCGAIRLRRASAAIEA